MNISPSQIVNVAAAVLQRLDGSYLLAQRPKDKIWAGYWEFPGGKVESGETVKDALIRELREELGIEVVTAYPWLTRIHAYPHATVHLRFFRVTEWTGELYPHEGQQFSWQNLPQVSSVFQTAPVSPLLPANIFVLDALQLPVKYAISNADELGTERFLSKLHTQLEAGLRLIQVREKRLSPEAFRELAQQVVVMAHHFGARVLLNSDQMLAQQVGADGVHMTSMQLEQCSERPKLALCAASCHSLQELKRAESLGCDFALLSPVLPTQSHPGSAHLGWEKFASITEGSSIPVYALGGLTDADMTTAWHFGAHGIALLRQAW